MLGCYATKLLLDPGFQYKFVSQQIVNELKLKPRRETNMAVIGFSGHHDENIKLKDYEIKVLPINSTAAK